MEGHRRFSPLRHTLAMLALSLLLSGCAGAGSGREGTAPAPSETEPPSASESPWSFVSPSEGQDNQEESRDSEVTEPEAVPLDYTWEECREMESGTILDAGRLGGGLEDSLFYEEGIPDAVFSVMESQSWHGTTARSDLSYLRMLYIGFDGEAHIGEMVVNRALASDVLAVFKELYEAGYPIEKMRLIDSYGGDDDLSMRDNNTSCFNDRRVPGTASTSKHALGLAIDVNPLYNPFIHKVDGVWRCDPAGSEAYRDREADFPYKIDEQDLCYQVFRKYGFSWGGDWSSMKDYQHFYKEVR